MSESQPIATSAPKPKRHLKNYLLDKSFQLTYALIIVVIAILLTGLLGFLIYHQTAESSRLHQKQSDEIIEIFKTQSNETISVFRAASKKTEKVFAKQSDETKKVFKEKSETATGILSLIVSQKEKYPELASMAKTSMDQMKKDDIADISKMSKHVEKSKKTLKTEIEKGITSKTKQLEKALSKMTEDKSKASVIRKKNNQRILFGVVIFSLIFIVIIFLYTIVLTHKVAGPLFKISNYFKKMEDGNFSKIWPLRKGDQLQEFYKKFEHAHGAIVAGKKDELKKLHSILADMDKSSPTADAMRDLIKEIELSLGDNI
ncbi:hypothetical protein KKF84_21080 [Myxococcota bacterium]|nr:hypothetical protein [Myxococcota bacterium]